MKRYLIEHDIPNVGILTHAQLKDLAVSLTARSPSFPGKCSGVQSFIDRTFCIYLAESEALIREHSQLVGFPITKITEVPPSSGR